MKLALGLTVAWVLQSTGASELSQMRERAVTIGELHRDDEITTEQARRRVQLLVRDLGTWAETHDVDLELRTRTHTSAAGSTGAPLSVNRCALFYDESADELCLIDLKRTEIWGSTVLFCRYLCE